MSYGIHIAGDCNSWYESGPVEDVLIRGNRFINTAYTGGPAISVSPITCRSRGEGNRDRRCVY